MAIVRGQLPQDQFLILRNSTARDRRLSFRARGVLAFILSLPPNGRTTVEAIAREGTEGREAVRKAMAELEAAGYVKRLIVRGEGGRIRTDTVVYGEPQPVDRAPETRSPVRAGETEETADQTGTQETGGRCPGSEKKKTGTTEDEEEDEPLAPPAAPEEGAPSSPSPRGSLQAEGLSDPADDGLTPVPSTAIPPACPTTAELNAESRRMNAETRRVNAETRAARARGEKPPRPEMATARQLAERVFSGAERPLARNVRTLAPVLADLLANGFTPEAIERAALAPTARAWTYEALAYGIRQAETAGQRPGAPRRKPAPPVVTAAGPRPARSPEEAAEIAATRAELKARLAAARERQQAEQDEPGPRTLSAPAEEVPA